MCIIVYKEKGVDMPSSEVIRNCFDNNPDGAGYMYNFKGKVFLEKGFMSIEEFEKSLNKLSKKIDLKDSSIVLHFRISTQAGVNKECTHPYPLSNDMKQLKKLSNKCDIGVAHNGIINLTSSKNVKDHNDTMEFITEYLSLIVKNKDFYKNENIVSLIKKLCNSKLAILDGDGHCTLIGDFIKEKDIYYSNSSYEAWQYPTNFGYGSYYNLDSKYFDACYDKKTGEYDFGYDCPLYYGFDQYCSKCSEREYCGDYIEKSCLYFDITEFEFEGKHYTMTDMQLIPYGHSLYYGTAVDDEGSEYEVEFIKDGKEYFVRDVIEY